MPQLQIGGQVVALNVAPIGVLKVPDGPFAVGRLRWKCAGGRNCRGNREANRETNKQDARGLRAFRELRMEVSFACERFITE